MDLKASVGNCVHSTSNQLITTSTMNPRRMATSVDGADLYNNPIFILKNLIEISNKFIFTCTFAVQCQVAMDYLM